MPGLADDLAGEMQLVGFNVDAVLIGGLGEDPEQNARVFSYPNIARAFGEVEMGADLYALHRNRWWQTKHGRCSTPRAFVAGLEYAAQVEATVLGKPTAAYFDAALEALDAEPG